MIRVLLICILLAGCVTTPDAIVPPPERKVHIDPRVLEPCEPLLFLSESASFEELITITVNNFEIYATCAEKQKNSALLLKRFTNKE